MPKKRCALVIATVFVVAACAARRSNPEAARLYQGAYELSGVIGNAVVEGTLSFGEDAYWLETNQGACSGQLRSLARNRPDQGLRFGCGGLQVRFTHRDGVLDATAFASVRHTEVTGTRKECVSWAKHPQTGATVCQQYIDVPVERVVEHDGVLQVARMKD